MIVVGATAAAVDGSRKVMVVVKVIDAKMPKSLLYE